MPRSAPSTPSAGRAGRSDKQHEKPAALLLRLGDRRRGVRHHGDRRQRAHRVLAAVSAEFGWDRGVTAGAFSFGFVVSGIMSPLIGRLMDRFGPRAVMELGVVLMGGGMLLAPLTTQPWHLYLTIGVLGGAGSVCLGYSGQSLFVPNWFIRRRGLALGLAFAGVGVGSVTLLPWVQHMIEQTGWRTACTAMGILVFVVLAPINLLLRKRPEDIGLLADGDAGPSSTSAKPVSNIVDPVWAATDWTLSLAVPT